MSEAIKAAQEAIERAERITREIYDMVDAAPDQMQQVRTIAYLSQENEVLIERIRLLEISLASEREACAKVADAYGYHMEKEAFDKGSDAEMEAMISAANSIASLIRGRGEK